MTQISPRCICTEIFTESYTWPNVRNLQGNETHILNSTVYQILITGWKHAYRIESQSHMMRLQWCGWLYSLNFPMQHKCSAYILQGCLLWYVNLTVCERCWIETSGLLNQNLYSTALAVPDSSYDPANKFQLWSDKNILKALFIGYERKNCKPFLPQM